MLYPGAVSYVRFETEVALKLGFVVEKGYEISKQKAFVCMGTEEKPHGLGSSIGSSQSFQPKNGVIRLRFENDSKFSTKVAVYTKANPV